MTNDESRPSRHETLSESVSCRKRQGDLLSTPGGRYRTIMQEALSKFKKGAYAVDPGTKKVGKVIADPDSDQEVKLIFADKTKSGWLKVTKIAQASKEQADKYDSDAA